VASLKDVEKVADDLESLIGQLRSELQNGDFDRLTQIADQISERADNAAETFSSVNETLMSRISELGKRGGQGQGQRARAKAESSSRSQ
jgi:hypothetical protein